MAVKIVVYPYRPVPPRRHVPGPRGLGALLLPALLLFLALLLPILAAGNAGAATPCDQATLPGQCAWVDASGLPPFVHDAILAKGGTFGTGNVLILGSGDPLDPDSEISNDMGQPGCGTNPDGWETYDCTLLGSFVPPQDSVVLALSSEWFEWYQTIFTDWMTISGAGVPTVDVSINSWINNKVDIIPYGPWDTGVVILTSLSAQKMVDFRVADSGDHIYDTDLVVVPASWFSGINQTGTDPTLLCGDGKLAPGEECDDGNNIADDGCSNLCLGSQPAPTTPPVASTCGNLKYTWPTGTTAPYTCGSDLCAGFRCVAGNTISPACYTAAQCAAACAGSCVDIQTAQLDCSTMCKIQPPATQPPPPLPQTCSQLKYAWPDGTTAPYACDDACQGQRCLTGVTISPECYAAGECAGVCNGTCVDVPAADCGALCALAVLPTSCTPAELGQTRPAQKQDGPCQGNVEVCNSSGKWVLTSGSFHPDGDEKCNGIDDDCNGAVDDMFVTCGDPGLCQNTVNKCDPANPSVPVACQTLPPPSPVEICNNGLDDDCDGSVDDGCECGDEECMPGEDWFNCPQDCTTPPLAGTLCSDGDACTQGDYWSGGVCMPGYPVDCTGGSACLVAAACDPVTGCSATKLDCNDWIDCTTDGCDSVSGCFHTPSDTACDDGDPCTLDTCDLATGCLHDVIPACASTDADQDGYASIATGGADCDDADAAVNPGAAEVCNGIDDNCDAQVDEGWAVGNACDSAPNACGQTAAGLLVCGADTVSVVCDAATPGLPAGYGGTCQSVGNACGQTSSGTVDCAGACDALPPADPAGYGNACTSVANSCGETAAGTIQCDGSCSAGTPANPPGYGDACASAANSCGETAAGTIQCDGSCSAATPANPAGYGDACASAANSCGETAAGTIQCDGSCSAVTPANPAGYGDACASAANSCGETTTGTIQCDGSCSAVPPANPAGYGDACASSANSCGETAAGTIQCDGSCSAVTPANPLGYGDECDSAPNVCGETAVGTQQCDGSCDAPIPAVVDTDADGVPDCLDGCPSDPAKTAPDSCGCGFADTDANNNGTIDCLESTKADVGITAEVLSKVVKPNKRVRIRWEFTNRGPDRVTPGMLIEGSLTGGPFSEVRLPTGCAGIPEDFACETDVFLAGRTKAMKLGVISASGTSAHLVLKVSSPLVDPDPSNQTAMVDYTVP